MVWIPFRINCYIYLNYQCVLYIYFYVLNFNINNILTFFFLLLERPPLS